jgi:hypothetical protein
MKVRRHNRNMYRGIFKQRNSAKIWTERSVDNEGLRQLTLVETSSKIATCRNLYWRFQLQHASENKQVGPPQGTASVNIFGGCFN